MTGALAGILSFIPIYPLTFARNRLAADNGSKTREFTGFIDVITKTVKKGGPSAVYTGLISGLPGIIIYRMVYFGGMDISKYWLFPGGV